MIVSAEQFVWFVSGLTMGTAIFWMIVDTIRLRRALADGGDTHDRIFGSIVGLIVALVGIAGVLIFHLG